MLASYSVRMQYNTGFIRGYRSRPLKLHGRLIPGPAEAMATALRVAAARNGRAVACAEDATAFLLSRPRGAYTGARTVQRARILDFEGHMRRLGAFNRSKMGL